MHYVYKELALRLHRLLKSYHDFIDSTDESICETNILHGISTCIECKDDTFEFKVANRHFLMKGYVFLSTTTICIKTFELKLDYDTYPNSKLCHLSELDIIYTASEARFAKRVEKEGNDMLSSDPTIIKRFNIQYTTQLWKSIQKMENEEMPELDNITTR